MSQKDATEQSVIVKKCQDFLNSKIKAIKTSCIQKRYWEAEMSLEAYFQVVAKCRFHEVITGEEYGELIHKGNLMKAHLERQKEVNP